jgi:hypothetical protein
VGEARCVFRAAARIIMRPPLPHSQHPLSTPPSSPAGGPQHHTLANSFIRTPELVSKLFTVLAPRYA